MLAYLKENKQWLFSGIGVVAITVAVTLVKRYVFDHEREQPTNSTHIQASSEQTHILRSPLTLEEFERVRDDTTLTELQRQDFMKHEGRVVRWRVTVADVVQSYPGDLKSDICVVFRHISQKDFNPTHHYVASFPYTARDDLFILSEGDLIEFEGKLKISSSAGSYRGTVEDCTLLRHEKQKEP